MQSALSFLKIRSSVTQKQLYPILRREDIFGMNLDKLGMAPLITQYLNEMLAGKGAVRTALKKLLAE